MLKLTNYIQVAVCAHSAKERRQWVKFFEQAFGACTVFAGVGSWEGIREASLQVRHWTNEAVCDKLHGLVGALTVYQNGAEQQAIFVEVCDKGKLSAYVVDKPEEWQQVLIDLDEGLALAAWFDKQAEIHGEGG